MIVIFCDDINDQAFNICCMLYMTLHGACMLIMFVIIYIYIYIYI